MSANNEPYLFSEFHPATKQDWLAQLERDLKGRPLSELSTALGQDIVLPPFFHPDDMAEDATTALPDHRPDNTWDIGASIAVADPRAANHTALEELGGGANALLFQCAAALDPDAIALLLHDVEASYISLYFEVPAGTEEQSINTLAAYLVRRGIAPEDCRGSLSISAGTLAQHPALLRSAAAALPAFRWLHADARSYFAGAADPVPALRQATQAALHWMDVLTDQGYSPAFIQEKLWFSVSTGSSYFVELAKLRALRLLWANVLDAYGELPSTLAPVSAYLRFPEEEPHPHTHLIRAATQAMSAVLGGAACLYVPSAGLLDDTFNRRMARNVQHILVFESHLHRVKDPAAGSFYVEQLTQQLAARAWETLA